MSNIDDILNNPEGQTFNLDPGMFSLEVIRSLTRLEAYQCHVIRNQHRIIQLLKSGSLDEELAISTADTMMESMNEEAHADMIEVMTRIASRAK